VCIVQVIFVIIDNIESACEESSISILRANIDGPTLKCVCMSMCVYTSRIDVLCQSFCTSGVRSRPTTVVLPNAARYRTSYEYCLSKFYTYPATFTTFVDLNPHLKNGLFHISAEILHTNARARTSIELI